MMQIQGIVTRRSEQFMGSKSESVSCFSSSASGEF